MMEKALTAMVVMTGGFLLFATYVASQQGKDE